MQKCSHCSEINSSASTFCKGCGKKLVRSKVNVLRNFIMILSVLFSLTAIVGIVYFIWTNNNESLIQSFFFKKDNIDEQEKKTLENPDINALMTEELSKDQDRVLSLFGSPDQFTVLFDESNNNKRTEMWTFIDMEAVFIFVDGIYNDTEHYFGKASKKTAYTLSPQDFVYGMSKVEVETLIGQKGTESIEENTGLNILIFGQGEIICIFNPENRLIIASKLNKLSDAI